MKGVSFLFLVLVPMLVSAGIIRGESREQVKDAWSFEVVNGVHGARKVGYLTAWENSTPNTVHSCSATLIGKKHLLTAAHCVINIRDAKPFDNLEFHPRKVGKDDYSPTRVFVTSGYVLKDYLKKNKELIFTLTPTLSSIDLGMIRNDIAILEVKNPKSSKGTGDQLGTYGTWRQEFDLSLGSDDIFDMYLLSYPGDKPNATLWYEECYLRHEVYNVALTTCDTYPGASGASVLQYSPKYDNYYVTGVVSAQTETRNVVALFTPELRADFRAIMDGKAQPNGLFAPVKFKTKQFIHVGIHNKCKESVKVAIRYKNAEKEQWRTIGGYLSKGEVLRSDASNNTFWYYWATSSNYNWNGDSRQLTFDGDTFDSRERQVKAKKENEQLWGDTVIDLTCNN
ncbi:trypsin-like serine protease [Vibrio sp. SCSIO 43136]|uniref:trypsin-like serine peptidase n=1 Tax=Vibrio sp. SCSIO 43136 TaxID=2819101 RepID=UPI0020750682|nr:trypsin-like serine protease [Vibrio sp. SCSIO 43136]USD68051.1 trypsin-like serine protease [Vibrio sp. SCSIO 43136]